MRKQERETTLKRAYEILDEAAFITIACIDTKGYPYAVNVSAVRHNQSLYFHCALEGKKWDCIKLHPNVCISAVCNCTTLPERQSVAYASCIANGVASIIEDSEEKRFALHSICEKYTPQHMHCMDSMSALGIKQTGVIKITLQTITGKENK